MWHLQHKNIHNKSVVTWKVVFLISGFGHLLIILLCLFYQNQPVLALTVTKKLSAGPSLKFLAPRSSVRPSLDSSNNTHNLKNKTRTVSQVAQKKQKKQSVVQEKRVQNIGTKQENKKVGLKKSGAQATSGKTNVTKTPVITQPVLPVNTPVVKPVVKKDGPPKSRVQKQEKKRETKATKIKSIPESSISSVSSVSGNDLIHSTVPAIVDNNNPDPKASEREAIEIKDTGVTHPIYEELQRQLSHYWHTPVGIRATKECVVRVFINDNGMLSSITMVQESGILMYDASVKMACAQVQWPRYLHGKELMITFN